LSRILREKNFKTVPREKVSGTFRGAKLTRC
jgi:hypothetical protein